MDVIVMSKNFKVWAKTSNRIIFKWGVSHSTFSMNNIFQDISVVGCPRAERG